MHHHALIMILANTLSGRFHPICYIEDKEEKIKDCIVYKSKCHHKEGFENRYTALREAGKMQIKYIKKGYSIRMETYRNLEWIDDQEPSDRQIRPCDMEKEDHIIHINCTAQCILQTQLREKFGCVVIPHLIIHNGQMAKYIWWRFYDGMIESSYKPSGEDPDMGEFETYEEALQAGIEEAFNFIEQ